MNSRINDIKVREKNFHDNRFVNDKRKSLNVIYDFNKPVKEYFNNIVNKNVSGNKILELGCGTGTNTIAISEKGADATGIDISLEAISRAKHTAQEQNKDVQYYEMAVEDMSFNDYIEIRKLALLIESIINNHPFEAFFRYAVIMGTSRFNFLLMILNNMHKAPKKIIDIFNGFERESKEELWNSEAEMIKYYQKDENYKKLVRGDAGGNLIYKYKSMNLATAMPEWIKYLTNLLEELVTNRHNLKKTSKHVKQKLQEIYMLAEYHKNRTWKFLDSKSSEHNVMMESIYDFKAWLDEAKPQPLDLYRVKNPIRYIFTYTEKQKKERYDQFRRYGTDINALSKIVTRTRQENWLRSVGTDLNFIKDNFNTRRSRTRYAMSN